MRKHRFLSSLLVVLVLSSVVLWLSAAPAWAQSTDSGTVSGLITDPSGAVIGGATVKLIDTSTNSSQTTVTNDAGRYTFASVTPGVYNLSVTKTGFSTTKAEHQQVTVGSTRTVNLALQVGSTNVVVEVTAAGNELANHRCYGRTDHHR